MSKQREKVWVVESSLLGGKRRSFVVHYNRKRDGCSGEEADLEQFYY